MEFDDGFCELEFFWIKYDHFAGKFCQEPADRVKVGRDVHIKQKCVINAFSVISKVVINYFIHPLTVPVPNCNKPLGTNAILISYLLRSLIKVVMWR